MSRVVAVLRPAVTGVFVKVPTLIVPSSFNPPPDPPGSGDPK
jgi:hypothetical protein